MIHEWLYYVCRIDNNFISCNVKLFLGNCVRLLVVGFTTFKSRAASRPGTAESSELAPSPHGNCCRNPKSENWKRGEGGIRTKQGWASLMHDCTVCAWHRGPHSSEYILDNIINFYGLTSRVVWWPMKWDYKDWSSCLQTLCIYLWVNYRVRHIFLGTRAD